MPERWGQTAQCQTSWPLPTRGLLRAAAVLALGLPDTDGWAGRRRRHLTSSLEDVHRHSQKNVSCARPASRFRTHVSRGSLAIREQTNSCPKGGRRPRATPWAGFRRWEKALFPQVSGVQNREKLLGERLLFVAKGAASKPFCPHPRRQEFRVIYMEVRIQFDCYPDTQMGSTSSSNSQLLLRLEI